MKNKKLVAWARYAGICGALLVPALVVAQVTIPRDFTGGTTLTASALNEMLAALRGVNTRVDTLAGKGFAACRWTPFTNAGTALNATANCGSDILISGGCNGSGSTLVRESRVDETVNGWVCESSQPGIRAQALCCPR
jgi:hypothetical protein